MSGRPQPPAFEPPGRRRFAALVFAGAVAACVTPDTTGKPPPLPAPRRASESCNGRFQVLNSSPWTVQAIYFSPVSERMWGPDRLSRYDVLRHSQTVEFELQPGVLHDVMIAWEHGRRAELRRVDVCRTPRLIVTVSGLRAE